MNIPNTTSTKVREWELYQLADRQSGYFSSAQAARVGYSRRLQHHYHGSGEWLKIYRGVYRLLFYPECADEQLACMSVWSHDKESRPRAIVSHETALALHDISDAMPSKVHMSVPRSFRKEPLFGLVLHRIGNRNGFSKTDIEDHGGFLVTNPARTILDVANDPTISPEHLENGIKDALDKGLLTSSDIYALLERISDNWRRDIAKAATKSTLI